MTVLDAAPWEAAAKLWEPKQRRWASPLDLAQELDPTVVRTPALELINSVLVDIADGREDRVIISMPPQEAKSSTTAYRFVQWVLADVDRNARCLIISYAEEIARRWGADIKRDFEMYNGDEGTLDLGVRLRADSRAAGRWQVDGAKGGVACASISGSVTGRPADLMVIDDPIKDLEQAQSVVYRERFQRFWQAVAVPRLGPGARAVLIQTRWHEEDAAGWLIRTEGDRRRGGRWRVINIPAQAEDEDDPLGRKPGEYMISARGNRDWEAIKASVGTYVWAALYQGHPAPAEGGLFKRIWWRMWSPAGEQRIYLGGRVADLRDAWRFGTVDLAASTRTSADYTVISAWARTLAGDLVLLDRVRAKIGEEQHFAQARPLVERWQLDTLFVEASQYGFTLVKEATQHGVPVTPVQAETDKFSRALPYSAWCSNGRVWLPAHATWVDEWRDEHAQFPAGRNDDQVDTGSLATRVAITQWVPLVNRTQQATVQPTELERAPDPFGGNEITDWDQTAF